MSGWLDTLSYLKQNNPSVIKAFGFDEFDEDYSYMCTFNRNTFPKKGYWVDNNGAKWFRTGLSTFEIRIKDGLENRDTFPIQEDKITITRSIKKLATISIMCTVSAVYKKTMEELDDVDSPYGFSIVCALIVLVPNDIEITMVD
jgi:hypothetical protein